MTDKILKKLTNDKDEVYFLVVASDNPGGLVRELWESVSGLYVGPRDDEDACGEWTDRGREFRTTVGREGVCIRTHAWHPDDDKDQLHKDVLAFLRGRGLEV